MRKLFLSAVLFASFPFINQAQTKADSTQSGSPANQIQNDCCSQGNKKSGSKCADLHSKKGKKMKSDDQRKSLKNQIPPRSQWIIKTQNNERGI